jgi:hypothetical protein
MTMEEFKLISRCNGSFTESFRPDMNEQQSDRDMISAIENGTLRSNEIYDNKLCIINHDPNNVECKGTLNIMIKKANLDVFRTCIFASTRRENFYIVATTSRKVLGQTGDGHFSPIAALNNMEDYLLLLDTARFKYNSMWFKVSDVYSSFMPIDTATNKPRGFLLCSRYH